MLSVAIVGPGLVGSALIAQLTQQTRWPVSIVAVANSSRTLLSETSVDSATWQSQLAGSSPLPIEAVVAHLESRLPAVLIDCTSSKAIAELYPHVLSRGISVATPSKKAFSGDLALWESLRPFFTYTSPARGIVAHESSVGAGLPVISTLAALVGTGDRVARIEGVFSGTLSYLFNTFSPSEADGDKAASPFSEIVKGAKAMGYTEPDPRDDLNGLDVARKVIILARIIGLPLTLETLSVENIVPEPIRDVASTDEFMRKLPHFDAHFNKLNRDAASNGHVLRYVGLVDSTDPAKCCVKLITYPKSHPLAALKGSDNFIKFTTKRFPNGIIIQGAGAGADVTAHGIFADLIRIGETVHWGLS